MIKDTRPWERIKKRILSANRAKIKTGFFEEDRYPADRGGHPVAYVAAVQELGNTDKPMIPPRAFIREGTVQEVKRNKNNVKKKMKIALNRVVAQNSSVRSAYLPVAESLSLIMREAIETWSFPPNAPSTIAKKGFNDPLIEDKIMKNSVKSKIETS